VEQSKSGENGTVMAEAQRRLPPASHLTGSDIDRILHQSAQVPELTTEQQDAQPVRCFGKRMLTLVPRPTSEAIAIVPRRASVNRLWTIAIPNPAPPWPCFVV